MWSKKWYLKRNISCDAHLLNGLLETDVPWDDAIVVSAGKLRKLWDYPEWNAQFSVWKTTGKDSSEACAIACQNYVVYSVFLQVWRHTVKSPSLTESVKRTEVCLLTLVKLYSFLSPNWKWREQFSFSEMSILFYQTPRRDLPRTEIFIIPRGIKNNWKLGPEIQGKLYLQV